MMLEQLVSKCKITKLIKYLNLKVKTIKVLEENTGISLHDLRFGNGFPGGTPKV